MMLLSSSPDAVKRSLISRTRVIPSRSGSLEGAPGTTTAIDAEVDGIGAVVSAGATAPVREAPLRRTGPTPSVAT
jgi:hypothetical protein